MSTFRTPSSESAGRLEGLDALRGIAAVLVVMLHAAMSYLHRPMPGLIWPVKDTASPLVDGVCWAIEGFIMPLFFLQAGLFAAGLQQKLGPREFLKHRARRLLGPMALACLLVLPFDFLVWTTGLLCDGRVTWAQFQRMNFDRSIKRELYGFSHLWFLQYLFLWCAALAAAWWIRTKWAARTSASGPTKNARERTTNWPIPSLISAGVLLILCWDPNIVVGFQHSFLPVIPKFLHAGLFFALGIWLHGEPKRMEQVARWSSPLLLAAAPAFALMLPGIHQQQLRILPTKERFVLAAGMAIYAVAMSLGLFGLFQSRVRRCPPLLKQLAEASFWIYLAHHPLVGLIQIDLSGTALLPEVKFLIVTLLTLGLCVASYETLVRRTWIGVVLNGKKSPPRVDSAVGPEPQHSAKAA